MAIKTRFSISADGCVTTLEGWPSVSADPGDARPVPDGAVDVVYSVAR
jgi:hypothetical protein